MPPPKKKAGARNPKASKQPEPQPLPPPPVATPEVVEEIDKVAEAENLRFIELIEIVRTTKNPKVENQAFLEIFEKLEPRIRKMTNRFTIPGLNNDDIMQEALLALRNKAIKDYDQTRGRGEGPARFDRFATMCIRRHLHTELKSSHQNNRKKVLNLSMSLDQETRGNDDDLSLSSIIPSVDGDILTELGDREYFRNLMTSLVKHLSKFEREVLGLYAQRLSYEEIADRINEKRVKVKVNVKGVDNALSRIKKKAKQILTENEPTSDEEEDAQQSIRRTLSKIKTARDNDRDNAVNDRRMLGDDADEE